MKLHVTKPPKVALCRLCHGTGMVRQEDATGYADRCPQCEGTGRVMVSATVQYDIRAYRPKVL